MTVSVFRRRVQSGDAAGKELHRGGDDNREAFDETDGHDGSAKPGDEIDG